MKSYILIVSSLTSQFVLRLRCRVAPVFIMKCKPDAPKYLHRRRARIHLRTHCLIAEASAKLFYLSAQSKPECEAAARAHVHVIEFFNLFIVVLTANSWNISPNCNQMIKCNFEMCAKRAVSTAKRYSYHFIAELKQKDGRNDKNACTTQFIEIPRCQQ